MKSDNHYIEKISKNKLYKMGYEQFLNYWHIEKEQSHILNIISSKLSEFEDWVYTRRKDKTELFHVIIYIKRK